MDHLPVSPLKPKTMAVLEPLRGLKIATGNSGTRYKGRDDVTLTVFPEGTAVAGVFTKSRCPSAPVDWSRQALAAGDGTARALLVNAGNANAFTGARGADACRMTAEAVAAAVGCSAQEVMLSSTGVIGEPLEATEIAAAATRLAQEASSAHHLEDAAQAIMTTDTFPKWAVARAGEVTVSGICKGSGMVAPDMATMLGYIFIDAPLPADWLQATLSDAVERTFNSVTVDSDTSTSDTVLAFALGGGGPEPATLDSVREAVYAVCDQLAEMLARDGEGASKLIQIDVEGAETDASAKTIGLSIANSPLVKTAVAGQDANWGRVVMAVGKAGEPADRDRLAIWFGPHRVATDGLRDSAYSEDAVSAYMQRDEITIRVALGMGTGSARVRTCDLTHGYITINGDYRS